MVLDVLDTLSVMSRGASSAESDGGQVSSDSDGSDTDMQVTSVASTSAPKRSRAATTDAARTKKKKKSGPSRSHARRQFEDDADRMRCVHCAETFAVGTNLSRLRKHLGKCVGIPLDERNAALGVRPPGGNIAGLLGAVSTKSVREQARELLTRLTCSGSLPFAVVDSPDFRALLALRTDSVPSSKWLRTKGVASAWTASRAEVVCHLAAAGVASLQLDAWTSLRGESFMAFVLRCGNGRVFCWALQDVSRESHTSDNIAMWCNAARAEIVAAVRAAYPASTFDVVSVTTDNARNMVNARWQCLQKGFAIGNGCVCHWLHLLAGDILKHSVFSETFNAARNIVHHFRTHTISSAVLRAARRKHNITKSLVSGGDTRWGLFFMCAQSLLLNRPALMDCVNDAGTPPSVRDTILSEPFWVLIDRVAALLGVIMSACSVLEGDYAFLSDAYVCLTWLRRSLDDGLVAFERSARAVPGLSQQLDGTVDVLKKLSEEQAASMRQHVAAAAKARIDAALAPLVVAAYLLDPREGFRGRGLSQPDRESVRTMFSNVEVFRRTRDQVGGTWRVNPTSGLTCLGVSDWEVLCERSGFEAVRQVNNNPFLFWQRQVRLGVEGTTPGLIELSSSARLVFCCPPSSAATERVFSRFGRVHCKQRAKLGAVTGSMATLVSFNNASLRVGERGVFPSADSVRVALESRARVYTRACTGAASALGRALQPVDSADLAAQGQPGDDAVMNTSCYKQIETSGDGDRLELPDTEQMLADMAEGERDVKMDGEGCSLLS